MLARREERRRGPSPLPIRRTRTTTGTCDDHYMDPRIKSRDPSPGGVGRLSTSAPSEDVAYWGRRYRDQRPFSADHMDSYFVQGYRRDRDQRPFLDQFEGSGYATVPGFRTRDPSPRNSRVMSSSVPAAYVNGDVTAYRGGSRPKSFPDQRGTYLYEPPVQAGYDYDTTRQRELLSVDNRPSYRAQGSQHSAGSSAQSAGSSSRSAGSSAPSGGDVSPGSDEAMSSVTLTAERAMAMAENHGEYVHAEDGVRTLLTSLSCYLCGHLFRRPRILPCGHTFCSQCLAQLKEETMREGRHASGLQCTVEGRHKPEVGVQFVCPLPECRYTMRLMNLGRWSTRNKTVSDAVIGLRTMLESKQDAAVQTDITMDSMLVTIPRSLLEETPPPGTDRSLVRRNSASLVDRIVHRAMSMDSLSNNYYIPRQHVTWRSYVAMLGMHILQQVIHT